MVIKGIQVNAVRNSGFGRAWNREVKFSLNDMMKASANGFEEMVDELRTKRGFEGIIQKIAESNLELGQHDLDDFDKSEQSTKWEHRYWNSL